MRTIVSVLIFLIVSKEADSQLQSKRWEFYKREAPKNDTVPAFIIVEDTKGYVFQFTNAGMDYDLTDTLKYILEVKRHDISYGPYKFMRRGKKVLFKDVNNDKKFKDFYLLQSDEFLSPEIFSTPAESYNIPNSVKYRNALVIEPYIRVDAGFSAQLLSEKSKRRSHSPFKDFQTIWASFEVFNLIDRRNIISFQTFKDFTNIVFAFPNQICADWGWLPTNISLLVISKAVKPFSISALFLGSLRAA